MRRHTSTLSEYGEEEALFNIQTLEILEGRLSKRAKMLVVEWALEHREELVSNWNKARKPEELNKIEPLK
ncbi:DUF4160 domain-containing protein [Persicitalea sp.]|uniref:DUF4160 domain-containing protein n=1 Tax=Persicitalea sp. TaxID=3100273 RepID=UPI0035931527